MDVSKLAVHLGLLAMAAAGPVVAHALVDNATALGVTGVWLALVREFDKTVVEPWFASLYKLDPMPDGTVDPALDGDDSKVA